MQVKGTRNDFHTEYATRVFKVAKNAMQAQGEQTLKLIDSAQVPDVHKASLPPPGRGKLINVVA